jgi:hypothetical protein
MIVIHILNKRKLMRRGNDGDQRARLFVPVTVLAFVVDIKTMPVVLDRGDAIAPAGQIGNNFFQQSRLPGVGFADNGYNGNHFYHEFPLFDGYIP